MKNNLQSNSAYNRYLSFNKDYADISAEYRKFDNWYFEHKAHTKNKDGVYVPADILASESSYLMNNFYNELVAMQRKNISVERMTSNDLKVMSFLNGFKMFSAWRMSLSVYQVDADIFEEMLKSPIPKDTPADIFKRLPDFCVYVEFPRLLDMRDINDKMPIEYDLKIKGFWAYLNYPIGGINKLELNICADVVEDERYPDSLSSVSMIIDDDLTVEQAADLVFEQYQGMSESQARQMSEADKLGLYAYLPILLWLCAEEPDISNMVGEPLTMSQVREPKYTQKKKTKQFVPPSNPKIYHIGQRLGGEIRKFKEQIELTDTSKKGTTKRPHIRKGHWHGYWHGSEQNKRFEAKWLSAIFVNTSTVF